MSRRAAPPRARRTRRVPQLTPPPPSYRAHVTVVKYDRAQRRALRLMETADIRHGVSTTLSNPFVTRGEGDRADAVAAYGQLLDGATLPELRARYPRLGLSPGAEGVSPEERARALEELLERLRRERSLVLVCTCAPLSCHGDVIRRWLLERV